LIAIFVGLESSTTLHYLENFTDTEVSYLKICSNQKDDVLNFAPAVN